MGWIALCLAVVSVKVWRHWIEPWREVDELLADVSEGRPPRKFLMTGTSRARPRPSQNRNIKRIAGG